MSSDEDDQMDTASTTVDSTDPTWEDDSDNETDRMAVYGGLSN